ncbi:BTB/POZ and TAZ domain-containing protein 1 [Rhododendron vialii]|uniref:BTB/POZ and TAZ domain-containing protein 1 n=1 Tax=Rhododendron vialii TaxID=182163 RepID=UPI0026602DAF|nr:BTB/POZ and TAZ domain-containing protein 1 [Rhododendron vialii]
MSPTNNWPSPIPVYSDQIPAEPLDVHVVTSGGQRIPAHRSVLASASPVLESMINRPRNHRSSSPPTVRILGVPCKAVAVFLRFLSAAKCSEEELDKYGIHLLALSHAFLVPQLKRICSKALTERLTIDNVIDMIQLAQLCDAPSLHLRCMKLIFNSIKSVEKTEGWKFVQDHDPLLELQVLQFINELQLRKKRRRRHIHEQSLYSQLSEAMECLEHICAEGCTSVGPCDVEPAKDRGPCGKFATCEGLQLLIRHFATCRKRVGGGGCSRCNRMWQLFRLHSSICDQPVFCRVPLCRQFKMKAEQEEKKGGGGDDERWKLLVRKVVSARAISSLSLPKGKRELEEDHEAQEMTDRSSWN